MRRYINNNLRIIFMNKIKLMKILGSILAILFGGFLVVYGGYDDSPGGQLLSLFIVVIGIVGLVRSQKGGK